MRRSVLAIRLRPYQLGDLWQLNGRLIAAARTTPYWEYRISPHDSLTMLIGGEIEGCLGCAYNGTTVELWSAPSRELVRSHSMEYARTVKRMVSRCGNHGLDVTVHADQRDARSVRWLEWLGFKDSGERSEWGDLKIVIMRLSRAEVGERSGH